MNYYKFLKEMGFTGKNTEPSLEGIEQVNEDTTFFNNCEIDLIEHKMMYINSKQLSLQFAA